LTGEHLDEQNAETSLQMGQERHQKAVQKIPGKSKTSGIYLPELWAGGSGQEGSLQTGGIVETGALQPRIT
jgi:hypothetical protein